MATTHIAYERSTGRIVLVHQYAGDPYDPEVDKRHAIRHGELSEDQVAVISVPAAEIDPTRRYRVDVERKSLIDAKPDEGGVSFGVSGTRAPSDS